MCVEHVICRNQITFIKLLKLLFICEINICILLEHLISSKITSCRNKCTSLGLFDGDLFRESRNSVYEVVVLSAV